MGNGIEPLMQEALPLYAHAAPQSSCYMRASGCVRSM